jgi:WD40 repeat protein
VSTHDLKVNEYVRIHDGLVKDMAFKPDDILLMTTSLDKTMKLTNLHSKSVAATFQLGERGWSCCWSRDRSTSCYVGLNNGTIVECDIRKPNAIVQTLPAFDPKPIASMQYVPVKNGRSNRPFTGLFCTSLSSTCFYELAQNNFPVTHALPFDGNFLPGHYEPELGYGLVSCRPSVKNNNHVTHQVVEFEMNSDDEVTAIIKRSFEGGCQAPTMSKSKIVADYSSVEENAFVFGADPFSKGVAIWDLNSGHRKQTIKIQPDNVLDMEVIYSTEEKVRVAILTDKFIHIVDRSNA